MYKDAPLKTVIFQPLLLGGRSIYSANIACLRHVLAVGAPYAKPSMGVLEYEKLQLDSTVSICLLYYRIMGANVVTSNGEIWKRVAAFLHVFLAQTHSQHLSRGFPRLWQARVSR